MQAQWSFMSKLFMGADFIQVKDLAKSKFKKYKPKASRNELKKHIHCATLNTL